MPQTTGATKDLAQSLRKPRRSFLRLRPYTGKTFIGPSSFVLCCTLEIFFACFGLALIFQAYFPLSQQSTNFSYWHLIFVLLILLNSMWLIYNGIRRTFSRAIVAPTLIISYLAYLTYPLAILDTATTLLPWCTFIGLYGLLAPLTAGNAIYHTLAHTLGFILCIFYSVLVSALITGISPEVNQVLPLVLLFTGYATLLGFFFCIGRFYAERSDVIYTETLTAQLQFRRSRDQSHTLQEFNKLVHDNVMAALLDASRSEGPIADRTRALAQRAITVIDDETNRVSPAHPVTFQELTEQIAVGVAPWNSRLRFIEDSDSILHLPKADPASEIPYNAARAFTHAVTEAVSNSARHSGTRTTQISIRTEMRRSIRSSRSSQARPHIYCTVSDRGQGFNVNNLDIRRMGVRVSMIHSMQEAGGKVTIQSAPDRGTRVVVQWPGDG